MFKWKEPEVNDATCGSRRSFWRSEATTAAPGAIWDLWTEVDTWPQWDTELRRATLDGPMRLGARGQLQPSRGPASRFVISLWEPGRRVRITTELPCASLVLTRTLEPAGAGCVFTHEVEFTGALGWGFAALLGGRFRAALPGVMRRVRQLAEAQP